jgi:alkylhydroperoxidase family enzyme
LRDNVAVCGLTMRQRGILVTACASTLGDAYCSLAWGTKLAAVSDAETAAGVLRGDDGGLTDQERALAAWARAVVRDPQGTTEADVRRLSAAGYSDEQIFGLTLFVSLRLAISTVNNALGARSDAQFRQKAPAAVLDAVTYGRPIAD